MPHDFSAKHYPDHPEFVAEHATESGSLSVLAALVEPDTLVLDVGCASGYLGRVLKSRGCVLVGIDANVEAAKAAERWYDTVHVADLDRLSLTEIIGADARFDTIVLGDVLEHLREPDALLESARAHLREDGYLLASIPNIAHGAMRLAMLGGEFDYQQYGLLDESHLRFFTKRTVEGLFLRTGYRIVSLERVRLPLFEESELVPTVRRSDYDERLVQMIERDPEHDVIQYVVRTQLLSTQGRIATLAAAHEEALAQREHFAAELERRTRERDRLREALERREAEYEELVARFDAFAREVGDATDREIARTRAALERSRG